MTKKIKLLFLVNNDHYFCSHRLPVALSAKLSGYEVIVVTRLRDHGSIITNNGFKAINLHFSRAYKNVVKDFFVLLKLIRIYVTEKPNIVHHVGLKACLFGSIASIFVKETKSINAITGLGYLFISQTLLTRMIRNLIEPFLRVLLKREKSWVIFQNTEDMNLFIKNNIARPNKSVLILGSGVDTSLYIPQEKTTQKKVVMLASRMLKHKGIIEFVNAAKRCHEINLGFRFVLVGPVDQDNPAAISEQQIKLWENDGIIEWWGERNNMHKILHEADIVCLPSYREGLPKILLEAAACGLPIITTDTPGCREVVKNNRNGFLVPVGDDIRLAEAIATLAKSQKQSSEMGKVGRGIVCQKFSIELVVEKTLGLYNKALEIN
jgi:glycosyltransferase involved in cell wall biosynthesis